MALNWRSMIGPAVPFSKSTWVVLVFCIVPFCYSWFWSFSSFYLVIIFSSSSLEIGLSYICYICPSSWIYCTNWCSSLIFGTANHLLRPLLLDYLVYLVSGFAVIPPLATLNRLKLLFSYIIPPFVDPIYSWIFNILLPRFGAFVASAGFHRVAIYKSEKLSPTHSVSQLLFSSLTRDWNGLADCICHLIPPVDISINQSTMMYSYKGAPLLKIESKNADSNQRFVPSLSPQTIVGTIMSYF